MACLTFSRHREGIAKRHYQNMIRRHATWMVIHPRCATFVSRFGFYFGEVLHEAIIRCCVRCWGPFGLAQLLGSGSRTGETPDLTVPRGSGLCSGGALGDRALPKLRPNGGYSVPLFAAQSRHEKPYPPISKIKFRLAFERQDGNSMPHSPAQRKRDFGKLKFCARFEM